MLGLTSHEAHFALLREEVRFGGKKSQRWTDLTLFLCAEIKSKINWVTETGVFFYWLLTKLIKF